MKRKRRIKKYRSLAECRMAKILKDLALGLDKAILQLKLHQLIGKNKVMDKLDVIHTGKGLVPQEQFGKKFEYIPCSLEQPYIELMDFNEFKKIWCSGRKEPKPTPIFKGCEFEKFAHLIDDVIKRDYEITSKNGEVKFIPKKK